MTELSDPADQDDGIELTREVLRALPPRDRGDKAVQAIVEGVLEAAELLEADDSDVASNNS
jgi:hypothetical protein